MGLTLCRFFNVVLPDNERSSWPPYPPARNKTRAVYPPGTSVPAFNCRWGPWHIVLIHGRMPSFCHKSKILGQDFHDCRSCGGHQSAARRWTSMDCGKNSCVTRRPARGGPGRCIGIGDGTDSGSTRPGWRRTTSTSCSFADGVSVCRLPFVGQHRVAVMPIDAHRRATAAGCPT